MRTQATAKFIGTSARKTGLVAGLIRGKQATNAELILDNADQRAAGPVGKALASAVANAINNHGANRDALIVEQVLIGKGRTLKRMRPRGKGSSAPILKRSSHITVILNDQKNDTKSVGKESK